MDIKDFDYFYQLSKNQDGKKYFNRDFSEVGVEVNKGYAPMIDYLEAVDNFYFED